MTVSPTELETCKDPAVPIAPELPTNCRSRDNCAKVKVEKRRDILKKMMRIIIVFAGFLLVVLTDQSFPVGRELLQSERESVRYN